LAQNDVGDERFNIKREQGALESYINLGVPRILRVGEGRFRSQMGGIWEIRTPHRGSQRIQYIVIIQDIQYYV